MVPQRLRSKGGNSSTMHRGREELQKEAIHQINVSPFFDEHGCSRDHDPANPRTLKTNKETFVSPPNNLGFSGGFRGNSQPAPRQHPRHIHPSTYPSSLPDSDFAARARHRTPRAVSRRSWPSPRDALPGEIDRQRIEEASCKTNSAACRKPQFSPRDGPVTARLQCPMRRDCTISSL